MNALPAHVSEKELYRELLTHTTGGQARYRNGDYAGAVDELTLAIETYTRLNLTPATDSLRSEALRNQALKLNRSALFVLFKATVRTGGTRDEIIERLLSSIEREGAMYRRLRAMIRSRGVRGVETDDNLDLVPIE